MTGAEGLCPPSGPTESSPEGATEWLTALGGMGMRKIQGFQTPWGLGMTRWSRAPRDDRLNGPEDRWR